MYSRVTTSCSAERVLGVYVMGQHQPGVSGTKTRRAGVSNKARGKLKARQLRANELLPYPASRLVTIHPSTHE